MSRVTWHRRRGQPLSRPAHAFLDGVPVCDAGAVAPGTLTPFQGRVTQPFEDAPMARTGRPFGRVCTQCESRLKVRGLAA